MNYNTDMTKHNTNSCDFSFSAQYLKISEANTSEICAFYNIPESSYGPPINGNFSTSSKPFSPATNP